MPWTRTRSTRESTSWWPEINWAKFGPNALSGKIVTDSMGPKPPYSLACRGGRYRTRTDDLFRVKEARYQLRQSP